ncbi:hypothetical protein RFI_20228, partial [Reticulomyxa filosa]
MYINVGVLHVSCLNIDKALILVVATCRLVVLIRYSINPTTDVNTQAQEVRRQITELFDKAMGVLVVRKKQMENIINMTEEEQMNALKTRITHLQTFAKQLLK